MDNHEQTTVPSGEAGATASQGQTDATVTQTAETTNSVSDGKVAETGSTQNPWDSDPKFKGKGAEDIYKSYKEIEKMSGKLGQRAKAMDLIEQAYGVTPEQLSQIITQRQQAQREDYIRQNPSAVALERTQQLEDKLAYMEAEKELDSYLSSEEGRSYAPFRDEIMELAMLKGESFGDVADRYFGQAIAHGQQSALQHIDRKISSQATSVTQGEQHKPKLEEMSVEELRAILPHAN